MGEIYQGVLSGSKTVGGGEINRTGKRERASVDAASNSEAVMAFWSCPEVGKVARPLIPALASHGRQAVPGRECDSGLK